MKESVRTRGLSWSCRHSSRITHLLECMFSLEHCICTKVGSSPFRVVPLLGDSSPCRGILFFRYRERKGRLLITEAALEENRVVALVLYDVVHVLEF